MISTISIFLNKEYSKYNPENKIWKNGLFSAIIVLLVFILFQPFGFKDKDLSLKLILFPGYTLFAFFHSYANFYIVRYILETKRKWSVKNEFLYFLISMLILTIAIQVFTHLVAGDMPLTIQWYLKLLYHVSSLFLVIGIIEFFYYSNRTAKFYNKQLTSKYQNAKQRLDYSEKLNKDTISLSLEKEEIEVSRSKLLYIQSMGNYLDLFLREENRIISKITKRGRLHKIEEDLKPFGEFFKCHRAFIINVKNSAKLKGNIKNARVVFEGQVEEIPVSRTYYKSLKDKLEKTTLS